MENTLKSTIDNKQKASFVFLFEIFQTVFVALALTAIIYIWIATPHQVEGKSMEQTFHDGELILSNKMIQHIGGSTLGDKINYDYKRGDVIIFRQAGKEDYIKRIIAEQNDTIVFRESKVFVNGKELDENYIPKEPGFKTDLPAAQYGFLNEGEEKVVPPGKYFVMGDNREHSMDSRYSSVGWVDRTEIRGKVFLRYWPINKFGLIPKGTYKEITE